MSKVEEEINWSVGLSKFVQVQLSKGEVSSTGR